jgi:hypothetical protein
MPYCRHIITWLGMFYNQTNLVNELLHVAGREDLHGGDRGELPAVLSIAMEVRDGLETRVKQGHAFLRTHTTRNSSLLEHVPRNCTPDKLVQSFEEGVHHVRRA